jgi:hypothetical protein
MYILGVDTQCNDVILYIVKQTNARGIAHDYNQYNNY